MLLCLSKFEITKDYVTMKVEQLYTNCLSESAYYIESNGEVAIIDPLRDPQPYIDQATKAGAKIKYVLETHFHADFVSGHVDLAQQTGATIVFGPNAQTSYSAHIAADNEILQLGNIQIKVLHTPGHTLESTTYLLIDENGNEHAIFSGDTLFIGDVGRPDLAVKSDLSSADLAGLLYDSLRNKIMVLPDDLLVYPAHGAGSACGKNISKETWSTLGEQKKSNYALSDISKQEFITQLTKNIPAAPQYFPKNVLLNQQGYESHAQVLANGLKPLSPELVENEVGNGALILDTRSPDIFRKGSISGAINIGLNGSFATWVGTLIPDITQPIIVIAELGSEEEAISRLSRVGFDNTIGFLTNGFDSWESSERSVFAVPSLTAEQLSKQMEIGQINLIDVRSSSEYSSQHVLGSINIPLDDLEKGMSQLDKTAKFYIHCKSGYRSMIAASILLKNGFNNIVDVQGGFLAISEHNIPTSKYRCPTTID